ncbi:MAG: glucose-1-phosphate adenylyltransferase [Verrucomicrobia bacterium]|nr:glucose-1-phosphate adenylyltransferase [Verrucomicrobiota bacterium]
METKTILSLSRIGAIIMGGGAGTRLFPLTRDRAKPAVPIGGKYRLVDIPISNCLNSDIHAIYVLTQFNSRSLHRHINETYKFDSFHGSFVEVLAAQQTPTGAHWYQGTADAVRQNLCTFLERDYDYFIILSGDQLYRMDYQAILRQHQETGADLTIACIPVNHAAAPQFGIMETDASLRITRFVEKPKEPSILKELKIKPSLLTQLQEKLEETLYLASMGIYVFNRKVLLDCLDNQFPDFGKNVIPAAITTHDVRAFIFRGYWEDIGTIRSFFNANLQLTDSSPPYSFYAPGAPIYTHTHFLPTSIIEEALIRRAIISDGCRIHGAQIERSVIGIRSIIRPGTSLKNTIMMGADFYESEYQEPSESLYPLGIGSHCNIEDAIIDKNARIGDHVTITPQGKTNDYKGPGYEVRDGIVIILKNAIIPSGTVI